ncbi:MAG TPA: ricin-type beta-trefoil lectin domain protein, partial [Catenuloplanes sp.]
MASTSPPAPSRRRRLPRLLATTTVVAGVLAAIALTYAPAQAAIGTPLINAATNNCLDVQGALTTAKTPVGVYACHGGANQSWELTPAGLLRVYEGTPMCLDVPGESRAPGVAPQIYGCHNGPNQRWRLNPNGTIASTQSGLCLQAADGVVRTAACGTGAAQRWTRPAAAGDTQPPSAPGGLRTAGLTCDSVTLSWAASRDNVGVTGYDIYHDGQQMTSVSGSTLSARLTLVPGAVWGLYVNARDAAGNVSQASPSHTVDVPRCENDVIAPSTPTGLAGTASGTSITLTWRPATDNISIAGYDIFRGKAKVGSVAGTALTFTDSGLTANTAFSYTVQARDPQGNVSRMSNAVTVRTAAACNTPVCTVRQVGTDTDIPWGLVTLPDGSILYARRDAHDIARMTPNNGAKSSIGAVPNVRSTDGEGGLMGLAISPSFLTDRWLYIMHTSPSDNRIVRMRVNPANRL